MKSEKFISIYAPHLVPEWSKRNGALTPSDVTIGSHRKVWWKGKCGHEWEAAVKNRVSRNSGCPYCSGNAVLPGFNDAATYAPWIVEEWSDKNGNLKPSDVTHQANRKVWWKGKCGHEWESRLADRIKKHTGCPYCTNERVERGINDITALAPEVAEELVEEEPENGDTASLKVHTINSHEMVLWKCKECGFEWKAQIYTRVRGGAECPVCKKRQIEEEAVKRYWERRERIDFIRDLPKATIGYYLETAGVDVLFFDDEVIGLPLDFYLVRENAAILIANPLLSKVRQRATAAACRNAGIRLLYIVPGGDQIYNNCHCITLTEDSPEVWNQAIQAAFDLFGVEVDVDVRRDRDGVFQWYRKNKNVLCRAGICGTEI